MSFRTAALLTFLFAGTAAAFTIEQPSADRWMYPFNATPADRPAASVFGATGTDGFDDRDGQFLIRFDTSSLDMAGYGLGSLTLTLTVNVDNSFSYDPTYDSYRSFLDPLSPDYLADTDAGSPIELFAVGYRNGYTEATFEEGSPFAVGSPMGEAVRNAFAAQFNESGLLIDVSNNVAGAFETVPLAIGQIAGVTPGSLVPGDAQVTFNIDLSNPVVLSWFQSSIAAGYVEFMVTSLYSTSQEATSGYPSFYNKENVLNDPEDPDSMVAGQLSGTLVAIPEPRTELLLALVGGLWLLARRRRRA